MLEKIKKYLSLQIYEVAAMVVRYKLSKEAFNSLAMAKRQLEFYGWESIDNVRYYLPYAKRVQIAIDYDGKLYHLIPYKKKVKKVT